MSLILLQAANGAEVLEAGEKTNLLEIMSNMGVIGIAVTLVIFLLSIVSIYIFVERFLAIKKAGSIDQNFMAQIREQMKAQNMQGALDICVRTDSPMARMVEKGIRRIGRPMKDINASIENVGNLEIFQLEKGLSTMATIAGAAPMLGFLGTVTGMITAFYKLSTSGNNIDPGQLAGGIYEAMLTTAAGLAVGIIAYVGYNYLVSMTKKVMFKMEATSAEFIDILQEPA